MLSWRLRISTARLQIEIDCPHILLEFATRCSVQQLVTMSAGSQNLMLMWLCGFDSELMIGFVKVGFSSSTFRFSIDVAVAYIKNIRSRVNLERDRKTPDHDTGDKDLSNCNDCCYAFKVGSAGRRSQRLEGAAHRFLE